jgi:hypothetical protein
LWFIFKAKGIMKSVLLAIDWSLVRVGLVILGMGVFTVIMETVVMVLFKFDSFGKSLSILSWQISDPYCWAFCCS